MLLRVVLKGSVSKEIKTDLSIQFSFLKLKKPLIFPWRTELNNYLMDFLCFKTLHTYFPKFK